MVEFALVLPVLALLLFAIVNLGVAFNDYLAITDAARAATRQASVTLGNPCSAAQTYLDANYASLDLVVDPASVCTTTAGSQWKAVIKQRNPTAVDLPGVPVHPLFSYQLRTTVTERKEQ